MKHHCNNELIFDVMLQFNVVQCSYIPAKKYCITIQSDYGKQDYKVGGKNTAVRKQSLSQQPLQPIWQ